MATPNYPPLSFWERADLALGQLAMVGAALYSAVTGVFRGETGAKQYAVHVVHAAVRKMVVRLSPRQIQHMGPPCSKAYEEFMTQKGLESNSVTLSNGATGHWFGSKNAKNVIIYYHGGGFALPTLPGHLDLCNKITTDLNASNHDIAIFYLAYTLTPHDVYPTQLRQAADALRYILADTARSPENVLLGGDSAGGNLALAVLLHLSHPHPDIEPLPTLSAPLAGVFGFAPWASFAVDGTSMQTNRYKDVIPPEVLDIWSSAYLGGKTSDAWSELDLAPLKWWEDLPVREVLVIAGKDEILFSAIDAFAGKLKSVMPRMTYLAVHGETHVAPVYSGRVVGLDTESTRALKEWLQACLN